MKLPKLLIIGLLTGAVAGTFFIWQNTRTPKPASPTANSGATQVSPPTTTQPAAPTPINASSNRAASSAGTTNALAIAPVSERRRPWDYAFLDSFHDAPKGSPIRFELVAGEFASGEINYTEFKDGKVVAIY